MTRRPCATCGRNRDLRFFKPRGRVCIDCQRKTTRARQRRGHVARTYNLDAAAYARLLAHQGGVCAICGGARRYSLAVDHDHATGAVRGLLCKADNKLLAIARDDPGRLVTAAAYLTMPPMALLDTQNPQQGRSDDDATAEGDAARPGASAAMVPPAKTGGREASEQSPATARVGGDEGRSGRGRPLAPLPDLIECWLCTQPTVRDTDYCAEHVERA